MEQTSTLETIIHGRWWQLIKSGFYFTSLSLLPAPLHPPSPLIPRIPRKLSELLPFWRLLQDGADGRWRPCPRRFSHLHVPPTQRLPHVSYQHWHCRWGQFTSSQVGMHDVRFFADILYADILRHIWPIINTYTVYVYFFPTPKCRDHQVSSVVELSHNIIMQTLTVLACQQIPA